MRVRQNIDDLRGSITRKVKASPSKQDDIGTPQDIDVDVQERPQDIADNVSADAADDVGGDIYQDTPSYDIPVFAQADDEQRGFDVAHDTAPDGSLDRHASSIGEAILEIVPDSSPADADADVEQSGDVSEEDRHAGIVEDGTEEAAEEEVSGGCADEIASEVVDAPEPSSIDSPSITISGFSQAPVIIIPTDHDEEPAEGEDAAVGSAEGLLTQQEPTVAESPSPMRHEEMYGQPKPIAQSILVPGPGFVAEPESVPVSEEETAPEGKSELEPEPESEAETASETAPEVAPETEGTEVADTAAAPAADIPALASKPSQLTQTTPEVSKEDRSTVATAAAKERRPTVARSTMLMTIGTLLSRITGLGRTWIMAYALGAGMLASAYQVANNLPNIIYETIAGGMIAAAFLPVFMLVAEREGKESENRYASNIINIVAIVLGAISVLGMAFAEPLVATQTFTVDGSENEVVRQSVWLFRIFSIQILFYGLSGVVQGMLNANRTFFITAIAPAINNVIVIAAFIAYACLVSTSADLALWILAIGTTAGVVVQFAVQIPAIRKQGFKWKPVLDFRDPHLRETLSIALPTIVFVIASIVSQSARNAFSLSTSDAGPAMIQYAWLWFQLPYGVIAVSLARTMFTEMSDAAARGDMAEFRIHVRRGLTQTLCLMIPCAFLLFSLSNQLVGVFQSGAFTSKDRDIVSWLLCVWAVGLPFYSIWCYLYNAFASLRRFLPFALMNVALTAVQVLMYWAFTSTPFGIYGIPLADVIYYGAYAIGSIVLIKSVMARMEAGRSVAAREKTATVGDTGTSIAGGTEGSAAIKRHRKRAGRIITIDDLLDMAKVAFASAIASCAIFCIAEVTPVPDGMGIALVESTIGGVLGLVIIGALVVVLKVGALQGVVTRVSAKLNRSKAQHARQDSDHVDVADDAGNDVGKSVGDDVGNGADSNDHETTDGDMLIVEEGVEG